MTTQRFTILTVPIDECEQVFWFVYDTQARRSLEVRSARDARAMCDNLNDGCALSAYVFEMLVTSAKEFAS